MITDKVNEELLGPKIVVLGGGTGLSILLRGLKQHTENLTAIVTVADDGGGSGVLREDLGMPPPGDIRDCLTALANTEPSMEKLLQYRFPSGKLKEQSFGNLFLAAMNGIYGDFQTAVKEASNVLAITGQVFPVTLDQVSLFAELSNGEIVEGESNIPNIVREKELTIERVFIDPKISLPIKEAMQAIEEADLIVLGPGSLYTSIIPNLLVYDMVESIYKADAPKVYISNIMTQTGETDNYNVLDHVKALLKHSREDFIDYLVVNKEYVSDDELRIYERDGCKPVLLCDSQRKELSDMNIEIIEYNMVDIKKDYIRHDNDILSKVLMDLIKTRPYKTK